MIQRDGLDHILSRKNKRRYCLSVNFPISSIIKFTKFCSLTIMQFTSLVLRWSQIMKVNVSYPDKPQKKSIP